MMRRQTGISMLTLIACLFLLPSLGSRSLLEARLNEDDGGGKPTQRKIADIPAGVTSFGAARIKDQIYFYGGHLGGAHAYSRENQNKTLYSIDLKNPSQWTSVGSGIGLQGMAMVSHGGKLYRVGGFRANNSTGEDHDLTSVPDFAVFDFDSKKWQPLVPMPEGRSSLDAVVIGDAIYVVGGWTLVSQGETKWMTTALKLDLSAKELKWETLPEPPFQRRALSTGFLGNKLYAIGGMQQKGGPTRKVAIFDIEKNQWSDGPTIPGDKALEGFGTSCFNVGGSLIVSTFSGNVYRLKAGSDQWGKIHQFEQGRFFHRLLEVSDTEFLMLGGANMSTGKSIDTVVVKIDE